MTYKAVILHPPPAIAAAVLSHYPGDHAHERSSLAFPNSSAVPNPMLMNQSDFSNARSPVIPLIAVLLLSKFLR
jgi:hypothetical protein